jgi:hypothetical protein
VPWPQILAEDDDETAADPGKGSFIFSLGATAARFELVIATDALFCSSWSFGFGEAGNELYVLKDGNGCGSMGQRAYAGPRDAGRLVGGTAEAYNQPYERWELWRL